MNTIAITGSSGFIGQYIVEELARAGENRVKVLSRNVRKGLEPSLLGPKVEFVCGDLRDSESLRGFFEPGCTVINLAYQRDGGELVNLTITNNLLKMCQHEQIGRLIHCSTADVVGRVQGNTISEVASCRPITKYAKLKLEIERLIINGSKGNFDVSIIRPTAVFGPRGDNLRMIADNLVKGNSLRNYFKHYLFRNRRMNLVRVENVVAALIFLTKHEGSLDGEVFFISDSDSSANNFTDVERILMRELRIPDYGLPHVLVPTLLLQFLLTLLNKDNINPHADFSPEKLVGLGLVRPASFEAGLVEYAAWYRKDHLYR